MTPNYDALSQYGFFSSNILDHRRLARSLVTKLPQHRFFLVEGATIKHLPSIDQSVLPLTVTITSEGIWYSHQADGITKLNRTEFISKLIETNVIKSLTPRT